MDMTEDMLEMLIGKYLDGEIAPDEQHMLEAELDNNFRARELLKELQDLHQQTRDAIDSEIIGRGKDAEEVFERAWQQKDIHPLRRIIELNSYMRFATGLAAGLIIGLALHFVLSNQMIPKSNEAPQVPIMRQIAAQVDDETADVQSPVLDSAEDVIRRVDWYNFTDKNGDQWLIEGFRENVAKPAIYYDGI
jgi:anti-sigma factor RsiW